MKGLIWKSTYIVAWQTAREANNCSELIELEAAMKAWGSESRQQPNNAYNQRLAVNSESQIAEVTKWYTQVFKKRFYFVRKFSLTIVNSVDGNEVRVTISTA